MPYIMIPALLILFITPLGCTQTDGTQTAPAHASTAHPATPPPTEAPDKGGEPSPVRTAPAPKETEDPKPAPAPTNPRPPRTTPSSVPKGPMVHVTTSRVMTKLSNPLKTKPFSIALDTKCTSVGVGGRNMDVGLVSIKGNVRWHNDSVRNVCKHGTCSEGARVSFIPGQRWLFAALNGDTVRKFSQKRGTPGAFRGGYKGKIQGFGVQRKFVAALYSHGLAVWRTSVGLISKRKQPGMRTLYTSPGRLLLAGPQQLILVTTSGKAKATASIHRLPKDALARKKGWVILFDDALRLYTDNLKEKSAYKLPVGHTVHGLYPIGDNAFGLVTEATGVWYLVHWDHALKKYMGTRLKGPTGTAAPLIARNRGCMALGVGMKLWFVKFK